MLSPSSVRLHSEAMTYTGIDKCDHCGQPLEDGQWLSGFCRACEMAQKAPKRPVAIVEPGRGVL